MFIKLGDFVIAERRSIKVRDVEININLRNDSADSANCTSGSGSCSPVKNREIVFTLEFVGKVTSNKILYDRLDDVLNDVCASTPMTWRYRACDEEIEEHTIIGAYMKRLDMDRERFGVRTGEVHLTTQDEHEPEIIQITLEPLG